MSFVLLVVAPALFAFGCCLALRIKESFLGYVGAAYLGGYLAAAARKALNIDPIRSLGFWDPLLWTFGGTLVIVLSSNAIRRSLKSARDSKRASST